MRKCLQGILLLWIITYALSGCGMPPGDEEGSAEVEEWFLGEAEPADVPASSLEPSPAPTSSPVPSPEPTPSPSPEPTETPAALSASPVYLIEYWELFSSIQVLPSTEDYEEYLAEDLCYHDVYKDPEDGVEYWNFDICLPQFGENMTCYRELNAYFEELYAQLLSRKDDFYDEIAQKDNRLYYEEYSYWGMTIGEQYLTVYVMNTGDFGGIRFYCGPMPVTFELTTGQPVTLPEILNCSEEEVKELVADYVYGYFLSQGNEYVWRDTYLCYEPRDFYMLEQGLGVYYPRYAIDCGAAGDFLFVIPYEDLSERISKEIRP